MSDETARKVPCRRSGAGFRVVDGQGVIAIPETRDVHLVNEVATRIWELIDGKRTAVEIAAVIHDEFDVSADTARSDVEEFLGVLESKGMLE
jgi:pyrroloquinoline quinone biosynthesis protein D